MKEKDFFLIILIKLYFSYQFIIVSFDFRYNCNLTNSTTQLGNNFKV